MPQRGGPFLRPARPYRHARPIAAGRISGRHGNAGPQFPSIYLEVLRRGFPKPANGACETSVAQRYYERVTCIAAWKGLLCTSIRPHPKSCVLLIVTMVAQVSLFQSIEDPQMHSAWTGGCRKEKSRLFPKIASALHCASICILHRKLPLIFQKTLFLLHFPSAIRPIIVQTKG